MSALLNSIIRLNCTQAPEPRRAEAKALQFRSARESPAIKLMEIIERRRASTGFYDAYVACFQTFARIRSAAVARNTAPQMES